MNTVVLPRQFNLVTMYPFLREVIGADQKPADKDFTFDYGALSFIEPDGITVLVNLLRWLGHQGVTVRHTNCRFRAPAIEYLDDCGYFTMLVGRPIRAWAAPRNTTLPIRWVRTQDCHGWLDLTMFPWLSGALQVPVGSLAEFQTCLREVFNNISDHSTASTGCIHVQWFPNRNSIRISVSDFGIGIPTEIAKAFKVPNDSAAINLATKDGVTSKPHGKNRGAGLAYLIDIVAGANKGWVGIYSNAGSVTCSSGPVGIRRNSQAMPGFYPGTLISMELRPNNIEISEETREAFEW